MSIQCRVSTDCPHYAELVKLGWRVASVNNGRALMVREREKDKGGRMARKQAARRFIGKRCNLAQVTP